MWYSPEKKSNLRRRDNEKTQVVYLFTMNGGTCLISTSPVLPSAITYADRAQEPASRRVILKPVTFEPGPRALINPSRWVVERVNFRPMTR
jgi:hypothetical protein